MAHFYKDVKVEAGDKTDFMTITWAEQPGFAIARASINYVHDQGDFDSSDYVSAIVIGYRTGTTSWHGAGGTSADHFNNCTGVAFAVAAKVDIRAYTTLEVSVYTDLSDLANLNSRVSLVDQGWTEVTKSQLQVWGIPTIVGFI